MKSAIFISNNRIQVIGFKKNKLGFNITENIFCDLEDKTIINGVITNKDEIKNKLISLKKQNKKLFKNPSLLIDSSSILNQNIPVPLLNKRQYSKIVREEMSDKGGAYSELLFGYTFRKEDDDQNSIFACAIPKEIVQSYVEIFLEADITIKKINIALEAIVNFALQEEKFSDKVAIINICDSENMFSLVFNKGRYIFSNRTRLFSDSDNSYTYQLFQSLSRLVQFNTAQKLEGSATSYYFGLPEAQINELRDSRTNLDINIEELDLSQYISCDLLLKNNMVGVMAPFCQGKSIDFLKIYDRSSKPYKESTPLKAKHIALGVLTLAIAGGVGYAAYQNNILKKEIESLNAYINDPKTTTDYSYSLQTSKELLALKAIESNLNKLDLAVDSYPTVSEEMLYTLEEKSLGKVNVLAIEFSADDNVLSLIGTTATPLDCSEYVIRLEEYSGYKSFWYTGYESKINNENVYMFSLTITLNQDK